MSGTLKYKTALIVGLWRKKITLRGVASFEGVIYAVTV